MFRSVTYSEYARYMSVKNIHGRIGICRATISIKCVLGTEERGIFIDSVKLYQSSLYKLNLRWQVSVLLACDQLSRGDAGRSHIRNENVLKTIHTRA